MMGHWQGWDKPFSCQTKKDKNMTTTVEVNPLVRRTEGEREAYSQGYLAGLDLAIEKCDGTVSLVLATERIKNVREGFLVARADFK